MNENALKIIFSILKATLFLFALAIYGLDAGILIKTLSDASIAIQGFNNYLSFSAIMISVLILGFFYLIAVFSLLAASFSKEPRAEFTLNIVISIATLLLNIPRESIMLKFISCFNYTSNSLAQSRAALNFIFAVILIVISFMSLFKEAKSTGAKIVKIVNFVALSVISIAIIAINILILINLKPVLKNPISPYSIDVGFYNLTEINQIKSNDYAKDDSYNLRTISKLSNVLYSKNKRWAYRDCPLTCYSRPSCTCTNYYWRFDNIYIQCTAEARRFYQDCENARGLRIGLKYLDSGPYPTFSCAIERNNTCVTGCTYLTNNYNLYLVQQNAGNVEVGWNGFCNCIKRYPDLTINQDFSVNLCSSGASGLVFNNFLMTSSILFVLIFGFKK